MAFRSAAATSPAQLDRGTTPDLCAKECFLEMVSLEVLQESISTTLWNDQITVINRSSMKTDQRLIITRLAQRGSLVMLLAIEAICALNGPLLSSFRH